MSLETLAQALPEYAKDIRLNLNALTREKALEPRRLWSCGLASALATGNSLTIKSIKAVCAEHLTEDEINAAHAAAAIMAMNNVYYRFTHLVSSDSYRTMPAKLRMNVMANPGVPKADFELMSLSVSAINGCGMCMDAHEEALRGEGVATTEIQAAVRVASIIAATAAVLNSIVDG